MDKPLEWLTFGGLDSSFIRCNMLRYCTLRATSQADLLSKRIAF